jgi:hypothetical protein
MVLAMAQGSVGVQLKISWAVQALAMPLLRLGNDWPAFAMP